MEPHRLCIVPSTLLTPQKAGLWLLALARCVWVSSFPGGFTHSRYLIYRELADSSQVLDGSAYTYQAKQALLFGQWADRDAHLSHRIAAFPQREGGAHHA